MLAKGVKHPTRPVLMPSVRINVLCRELGIKSRRLLEYLHVKGLTRFHHSSSIDDDLARDVRAHFSQQHVAAAAALRSPLPPSVPRHATLRERMIAKGAIRPADSALNAAHLRKPAKYTRCGECRQYVPKTEIEKHLAEHESTRRRRNHDESRSNRAQVRTVEAKEVARAALAETATRLPVPRPRRELTCTECRRLVHPASMESHMREHHSHPKLPELRSAQFSFVLLPSGHCWEYKDVFEHYRRLSRAQSF